MEKKTKEVKFNLRCDGNPIRTIEELQNNFSIEDILAYYHSGLLKKWLDVRGFRTYLEKVEKINSIDDFEVAKELAKIFEIKESEKELDEDLYILKWEKEQRECYNEYKLKDEIQKNAVDDYTSNYENLKSQILDFGNAYNISLLKANIKKLAEKYYYLLSMQSREIFWELYEQKAYIAIFCMLMNEKTRSLYISEKTESISDIGSETTFNNDKKQIENALWDCISTKEKIEEIANNAVDCINVFEIPTTEGNWRTSEKIDINKKYMIVRAPEYARISPYKSANETNTAQPFKHRKGDEFRIVEGIQYQNSTSTGNKFYYMEV